MFHQPGGKYWCGICTWPVWIWKCHCADLVGKDSERSLSDWISQRYSFFFLFPMVTTIPGIYSICHIHRCQYYYHMPYYCVYMLIMEIWHKLLDYWTVSSWKKITWKVFGSILEQLKRDTFSASNLVAVASRCNEFLLSTSAPAAWEEKPYLFCALKLTLQMNGDPALACASVRLRRRSISSSSHRGAKDLPAYWLHG